MTNEAPRMQNQLMAAPCVNLIHSSDLHLGADLPDPTLQLRRVLAGGECAGSDLVLLVGDTFEHVRYPMPFFEQTAEVLANAGRRVVILPGNHDPLFEGSEHWWRLLADVPNVTILGLPDDSPRIFEDLDLEVWGWAHRSYGTMEPLRQPPSRRARWHVALAHGHFTDEPYLPTQPAPSWIMTTPHIEALDTDYLALGHWNCHMRVGNGTVPAYYSGSPDLEHTVNIIRLSEDGVSVDRLDLPEHA
jgi:DNA repair exonuclease SbcCD nuclease subunit